MIRLLSSDLFGSNQKWSAPLSNCFETGSSCPYSGWPLPWTEVLVDHSLMKDLQKGSPFLVRSFPGLDQPWSGLKSLARYAHLDGPSASGLWLLQSWSKQPISPGPERTFSLSPKMLELRGSRFNLPDIKCISSILYIRPHMSGLQIPERNLDRKVFINGLYIFKAMLLCLRVL